MFIIITNCLPHFLSPFLPLFPPQILRPDSLTNGGTLTPSISIEVPDDSNPSTPPSSTPSSTNRPANQRQRRKPALPGVPLPQITESSDDNKGGGGGGLLQVKDHSGKRHSLTPESSRREMVPLQPSRSLDLGALPTWRNKTFISLHNYWTGEQQSDRLHMQAKAVRVSSLLPPFPSTFLSLNSPFLICLSLPFPPLSLPSLPFPPSFPYFVVFIITCLTCHTLCYMV